MEATSNDVGRYWASMVEANIWKICKCDKKEDRPFSDYNKETTRSLTAAAIQVRTMQIKAPHLMNSVASTNNDLLQLAYRKSH